MAPWTATFVKSRAAQREYLLLYMLGENVVCVPVYDERKNASDVKCGHGSETKLTPAGSEYFKSNGRQVSTPADALLTFHQRKKKGEFYIELLPRVCQVRRMFGGTDTIHAPESGTSSELSAMILRKSLQDFQSDTIRLSYVRELSRDDGMTGHGAMILDNGYGDRIAFVITSKADSGYGGSGTRELDPSDLHGSPALRSYILPHPFLLSRESVEREWTPGGAGVQLNEEAKGMMYAERTASVLEANKSDKRRVTSTVQTHKAGVADTSICAHAQRRMQTTPPRTNPTAWTEAA